MNETIILWTLGDMTLTAWSLCLALGAGAAVLLTVLLGRRQPGVDATLSLCLSAMAGAVIGGRLLYCLTMLESILVDFGAAFIPQLWAGGFTLFGAVLGGAAGAWLYARGTKRSPRTMADLLAPGAALVLMTGRLAEYFTGQGLGDYLMDEALYVFPAAVQSVYGDWQLPVFLYEAAAALAMLIAVLLVRRRGGRAGEVFLILLCLSQVLLESLREDEFIRFGFVRFNQLAAALLLAGVLAARILRMVRAGGWNAWQIVRMAIFGAGVGMIIALEFALDKSELDNILLYGVMAATLLAMGTALLVDGRKAEHLHV